MNRKSIVVAMALSSSLLYADIVKAPYYSALKGNEPIYYTQTLNGKEVYSVEKVYVSSKAYADGVAYFIPNKAYKIIINYMSSIDTYHVDAFISKGSNGKIDVCSNKVLSYTQDIYNYAKNNNITLGEAIVDKLKDPTKTIYYPMIPSLNIRFENINQKSLNYWLYFIPGTERPQISLSNDQKINDNDKMKYSFVYSFLKDDIDSFVNNTTFSDEIANRCANELTYLSSSFDSYINKINSRIKELNSNGANILFAPKKKSDFTTYDELKNYVNEISGNLSALNDSKINSYLSVITKGLMPGAEKRKNETENFCLYMNYITSLPEYTTNIGSEITKTNSCSELQNSNIEEFLSVNEPMYKINGIFVNYDFYGVRDAFDWVFVTEDNRVFQLRGNEPSSSNIFGWKEVKNINVDLNKPNSWYMAYLYDWDNDADKKFDWILVNKTDNSVYKLSGEKSGLFDYDGPINIKAKIIGNYIKFERQNNQISPINNTTNDGVVYNTTITNTNDAVITNEANQLMPKLK